MIALLDTTALMSDFSATGTVWQVLAHTARTWNLKIFVPEIVLMEAIGGYQRSIDDAISGLDGWAAKNRRLQLGSFSKMVQSTRDELTKAGPDYQERLRAALNELDVTVLAPPNVSHHLLVERAVRRQRPCDNKGDGYRDTLNWLTLLALATEHPDETVVWVSDNTKDFGSDSTSRELHPDLRAELDALDHAAYVRWVHHLSELVLHLAESHSIQTGKELDPVRRAVQKQALIEYVNQTLRPSLAGTKLSRQNCGLPRQTSATIIDVGEVSDLTADVRGTLDDQRTMVEFTFEALTTIELIYPATAEETVASSSHVTKVLRFSGPLAQDRYGRPLSAEVTDVVAQPDDPGLAQWAWLRHLEPAIRQSIRENLTGMSSAALRQGAVTPEELALAQRLRGAVTPEELALAQRLRGAVTPEDRASIQWWQGAVTPEQKASIDRLRGVVTPEEMALIQRLQGIVASTNLDSVVDAQQRLRLADGASASSRRTDDGDGDGETSTPDD